MSLSGNLSEMLTLVSLVLISWLVSYGSLGLFVAHCADWRWRLVAATCGFAPIYAVEAYELSIAFILQTSIVFGFARLTQRVPEPRTNRRGTYSPKARRGYQARLSDLCLVTLIVSQIFSVFVQVPNLNVLGWISMIMIGVCSGLSIGVGLLILRSRIQFLAKFLSVALVAFMAALPLARFDWLTRSFLGFEGWPPENVSGLMHTNEHVRSIWLILLPTTTFVCIWLAKRIPWVGGWADAKSAVGISRKAAILRRFATIGACSVWFASLAFAGGIYVRLGLPVSAPPAIVLPANSFQELASVAKSVAETRFVQNWLSRPGPRPSVRIYAEVFSDLEHVYLLLVEAKSLLHRPMAVSILQDEAETQEMHSNFRMLSRAFAAEGEYCRARRQYDEAADWYLASIRLGFATRRGGDILDEMVGRSLSSVGQVQLFQLRSTLSASALIEISATLTQLNDTAEPFEAFLERERYRDFVQLGWHVRLMDALAACCGVKLLDRQETELHSKIEKTRLRLIATELAIEAFRKQEERWPESLEELIPDYLPNIPQDPFSPEGTPLRIGRREDRTVLVYSVGADGVAQEHATFSKWNVADDDLWTDRGFQAHFELFGQ